MTLLYKNRSQAVENRLRSYNGLNQIGLFCVQPVASGTCISRSLYSLIFCGLWCLTGLMTHAMLWVTDVLRPA